MLGTNGGGFYNANSAHPFENPTALTNMVQMLSIFLIGFGLTWTFGKAVGNTRQGWAILSAMIIMVLAGILALTESFEALGKVDTSESINACPSFWACAKEQKRRRRTNGSRIINDQGFKKLSESL